MSPQKVTSTKKLSATVQVAIVTAIGAIIVALITGFFNLIQNQPMNLPSPTSSPTGATPTQVLLSKTIYSSSDIIHLGDDLERNGYNPLFGQCFLGDIEVDAPVQSLILEIELYGEESKNIIAINGIDVTTIPPQGGEFDEWSKSPITIVMSSDKLENLVIGKNTFSICAAKSMNASNTDDLDDFQFRNLIITAQYISK